MRIVHSSAGKSNQSRSMTAQKAVASEDDPSPLGCPDALIVARCWQLDEFLMDGNSRPGVHQVEPGRARACSRVPLLAWILPRYIKTRCTSDSVRFVCQRFADSLPVCRANCQNSGAYRSHLDKELRPDRDRIHAQSHCGVLRRGHCGGVPGRWNRTSQTRNSRLDDAIAPTATCIAVSSRSSTASRCGQTSGTALTGCSQQKVHATCKTKSQSSAVRTRRPRLHRAALHHRWCCRGTLQHHRGGSAPLPFHVGTLIGQRIQVSTSPLTTVACDWHSGWAWTTCDIAASKRANAAGQVLKQPAAQFPPQPCRRIGHPAGHGLREQQPRAISDSRALMTGVPGRSRIRALFQACNGRLSRNREMPDEVSILSLLACSHQGLCPTCHCVPPTGHRRCCP